MIKYLGSKRTLCPALGSIATAVEAKTAVDLFTGTTRVAQEFKTRGLHVTAVDTAAYSDVLAQCYVSTDSNAVNKDELANALTRLNALPGSPGYFTRTFCEEARYFQPKNGVRIDEIRDAIEKDYRDSALYPILLTSLMLAADKVDSTTGLQMAYLKQWAARAHHDLNLLAPELIPGTGRSILGDALHWVHELDPVDLVYLDPPYNQHRYFTNYHVWETLVRWDRPETYGVARKRIDARDRGGRSPFNSRRTMPDAMREVVSGAKGQTVVVSYNNEAWVTPEQIMGWLREAGHQEVRMLAFDYKRYIGAQIGIHNRRGQKVGTVSHTRNLEYLFVAGAADRVSAAAAAVSAG